MLCIFNCTIDIFVEWHSGNMFPPKIVLVWYGFMSYVIAQQRLLYINWWRDVVYIEWSDVTSPDRVMAATWLAVMALAGVICVLLSSLMSPIVQMVISLKLAFINCIMSAIISWLIIILMISYFTVSECGKYLRVDDIHMVYVCVYYTCILMYLNTERQQNHIPTTVILPAVRLCTYAYILSKVQCCCFPGFIAC